MKSRKTFFILLFLILVIIKNNIIAQNLKPILPKIEKSIAWYDASLWGAEGKGWQDVKRFYDRLPSKAENLVRKEVWDLSRSSAGMSIRFKTDAKVIMLKYTLFKSKLEMYHMPATGVSGVDLYAQLPDGNWNWLSVSRPISRICNDTLIKGLSGDVKSFALYLPLYNGIDSVEIGVPSSSLFEPVYPRKEKPIVFYGTSILQGACASRPGVAFTSILERRLNKPVINLGFSGQGKMEKEMCDLISEIDAAAFVIDCLPNMKSEDILQRTEYMVKVLKSKYPETPVLLVEERIFANSVFLDERRTMHKEKHALLKSIYIKLISEGYKNLFYLEGKNLIGTDGEGSTDGSHPNDLGMIRYADQYEPVLKEALKIK